MNEPSPRKSRLAIAGGLAAAIGLAGAGFLVGRGTAPVPLARQAPVKAQQSPAPPSRPQAALATLDRAALIALAERAADAFASGEEMPADVVEAAGMRLDLLLPFGCDGPASPDSSDSMRWHYDSGSETLRIDVAPRIWRTDEWEIEPVSQRITALQGFWIARPWTTATQCTSRRPAVETADSPPVPLAEQTLAIAATVESEGDGEGKARSFEIVRRIDAADFDPERGFQLRVVGRLDARPGASPVRCVQPGGHKARPSCLISASFAELRIENPANGAVLGVWPVTGTALVRPVRALLDRTDRGGARQRQSFRARKDDRTDV